ncbi:hypothetical protein DFJ58DRAFT_735855 [Suillus subalutaceus]|uniref:uncharacterized protein n=1 Tax=Suillus subalutaceus TaxID=48586 RepID=UPI001B868FC4|nr:uncharacterized protein DFJ58DRAFT_735855 [Suillus subalutaceus]KAG1834284.1 hypothetical protein DFJ58DRAFT_735855 [Suillus subalutaceus]
MSLSDLSFNTVTWSRKTTEESITLSKSLLPQSTPAKKPLPTLPSTSARLHHPSHPPSAATSSHPQSQTVTQTPCQVTVPIHSEIHPPRASETPEGFWVIIVGQEVGVFYCCDNAQKRYPSFQEALSAYTVKYDEGRVRAVPLPGGAFWPSPPESSPNPPSPTLSVDSSVSSDSYELWSQVEDLMETMSQL